MTLGSTNHDSENRHRPRTTMRDAINEAKHTLELLHDDLERGSNVHPDTITNLEADIQKYDLQDR